MKRVGEPILIFVPTITIRAIGNMIVTIIAFVLTLILSFILIPFTDITLAIYIGIYVFFIILLIALLTKKILLYKNPLARLKIFGQGILSVLEATHQLEFLHYQVKTELIGIYHVVYLVGETGHDKALFAKCVYEFNAPIDNQRYILYQSFRKNGFGKYQVVYTRNEEGRKILLKGRIKALANRQDRCVTRKRVKGALE